MWAVWASFNMNTTLPGVGIPTKAHYKDKKVMRPSTFIMGTCVVVRYLYIDVIPMVFSGQFVSTNQSMIFCCRFSDNMADNIICSISDLTFDKVWVMMFGNVYVYYKKRESVNS